MQDATELDPSRLIADTGDRRTFRRIDLNILAHVRLAAPPPLASLCDSAAEIPAASYEFNAVLVSDMSMTGLFFPSALVYPIGSEIEVSVSLNKTPFAVPGTIARRVRVDNRHSGYGVNFLQHRTSKEFRVALAAFLLRQDSAVPRPQMIAASRGR